jgi:dienelactone hydrolase
MTLDVDPRHDAAGSQGATRRRRSRLGWPAILTAIAGGSLAVLAAGDGSPGWQVARFGTVAALTVGAVAAQSRLGARQAGRLAAVTGILALAVGLGFVPYVMDQRASVQAVAGSIAVVAGLVLAVGGVVTATAGRRPLRRIAAGIGMLVVTVLTAFVVGPAVAATNVPRPSVGDTPASRGLTYQSVTVTTPDAVDLAGWYVPSTNGAAVVLLHGAGTTRSTVLDEAAVLAGNGFGVLMIDARGHGESHGRAMDFGWHGDADIEAATGFLAARPNVDDGRIGVVGSSMGGEEAIGASASNDLIRAVVSEGATARRAADEAWLSDRFGVRGMVQEQLEFLQDWITDALTDASPPTPLRAAVEASGTTRYLLITGGDVADEGHSAEYIARGAPDRVEIWTVDGAGHTGGLATAPEEWEATVVGFLDEALRGDIAAAP